MSGQTYQREYLQCDAGNLGADRHSCTRTFPDQFNPANPREITYAGFRDLREEAVVEGWRTTGSEDYCEAHAVSNCGSCGHDEDKHRYSDDTCRLCDCSGLTNDGRD